MKSILRLFVFPAFVLFSNFLIFSKTVLAAELSTDLITAEMTERQLNAPLNIEESLPQEKVPVFQIPTGSETLKNDYSHIDPKKIVPEQILRQAILFYDLNLEKLTNPLFMTVIDMNQHSSQRRFFLVEMKTGEVTALLTTAGVNSDPDDDGYATLFSNIVDSRQSSLGFFFTSSTYQGQNGYSLRLHGLNSTNSKAFERYIVVHGARYVSERENKAGRSWGCPALDHAVSRSVIDRIKNGSLLFISHAQFEMK